MNTEQEIWKPIKGYEGYYEVSNLGRVRGLDRIVPCANFTINRRGAIKTIHLNAYGYPSVTLCKDGKSKERRIHRLVAEAFIPNVEGKPEIDHINTDRTDFRIENLRWVTHKENMNNPISRKRVKQKWESEDVKRKSINSKIRNGGKTAPTRVYQFTLDGELVAEYESAQEAGRVTGLLACSINACCNRNRKGRKSCGGYLWSKKNEPPTYEPYKEKFKRVYQYDKDWNFIKEWESIKEACNAVGVLPSNVNRSASGKKKYLCGGYRWSYIKI